jgi:hypothetical protein
MEESGRFLKKAPQKLFSIWADGAETARAQFKKVFCFFFQKRSLPLLNLPPLTLQFGPIAS